MSLAATAGRRREIGPPSDSIRGARFAGWAIIWLFFGGLGIWAATAPLNAAVVGDAVVKVQGNRKSVQHLDGGIVKEILVREGDQVVAGDVVITLDDTQTRAQVDILRQRHIQLMATEARLRSELAGFESVAFPPALIAQRSDAVALAAMKDQDNEFLSRRVALVGREQVLQQRIAQYQEQITGIEAQKAPLQEQLDSLAAERVSLEDLLAKGLTTRGRILELQRRETEIGAQAAQLAANLAATLQAVAGLRQEIAQLPRDRAAEIAAELREVSTSLLDVSTQLEAAKASLDLTAIRTPYGGRVVDLAVFSVGAVVGRGERLMDIVPDDLSLIVEAKIRVEDIADIDPGMPAEIHFTSYKQRVTPVIAGSIAEVSADRLTDERTQVPYYVVEVAVDQGDLAASPEIQLYPGMPASVMITTKERTALDYLIGPLAASFEHAFKER